MRWAFNLPTACLYTSHSQTARRHVAHWCRLFKLWDMNYLSLFVFEYALFWWNRLFPCGFSWTSTNPTLGFIAYLRICLFKPSSLRAPPHSSQQSFPWDKHHRFQHDPLLAEVVSNPKLLWTTFLSSSLKGMHWWYFGFWSDTPRPGDRIVASEPWCQLAFLFLLVLWGFHFWWYFRLLPQSRLRKVLEFDYPFLASRPQTDLCLRCLGIPFLVRCHVMKYAQDAAACDLLHSRKMFLALSYAFFYHVGGILLDKGKVVPETHQIHHPDARTCGHSTRGAVPPAESRSKIEEVTHTLYQQDIRVSWASAQIFREITFVQGHSLSHLVLWCRCPPTWISSVLHLPEYHPVISYRLSRYPEFTYRKSVVWAFGSLSEQWLSPSWW